MRIGGSPKRLSDVIVNASNTWLDPADSLPLFGKSEQPGIPCAPEVEV